MRGNYNISINSMVLLISLIILATIGILIQLSAGGGDFLRFAFPHLTKIFMGFIILVIIYKFNLKYIFLLAEVAYVGSILLLVLVDIIGITKLGAQRWINLGFFVLQPSEIMKVSLILMLAKYFHKFSLSQVGKLKYYLVPIVLTLLPVFLVLVQPDLGTAIILLIIGVTGFFLGGLKKRYFGIAFLCLLVIIPILWMNLYDYQKQRIIIFLDPNLDPLGSGYHIIQSKIAIGSGGLFGKGYLAGTQGQLNFLPEKHTDFIFTLFAEELGFLGVLGLLTLYMIIIINCLFMSIKCQHNFGKIVIGSFISTFFVYIAINMSMVSGLLPVVGIPLPLISYGGTSTISLLAGFGLILNIDNNKTYN